MKGGNLIVRKVPAQKELKQSFFSDTATDVPSTRGSFSSQGLAGLGAPGSHLQLGAAASVYPRVPKKDYFMCVL